MNKCRLQSDGTMRTQRGKAIFMHSSRPFIVCIVVILAFVSTPSRADKFIIHDVISVTTSPSKLVAGQVATVTCTYVPVGSVEIGKGSPFYSVEHDPYFSNESEYLKSKDGRWAVFIDITLNGQPTSIFSDVNGLLDKKATLGGKVQLDPSLAGTNVKFGCEIDPLHRIHNSRKTITRHVGIGIYGYLLKPYDFKPTSLEMSSVPKSQHVTGQLRRVNPAHVMAGHKVNTSMFNAGKHTIPTIQAGTMLQFFCKWRAYPIISSTSKSIRTSGQILIDGQTYRTFPISVSGNYADASYLGVVNYPSDCGPSYKFKCHAQGEFGPIRWIARGAGVHTISCKVDSDGSSEIAKNLYNNTISKQIKVPLSATIHRTIHLPPQMRPHAKPAPAPMQRLNPNIKRSSLLLKKERSTTHG